MKTLLGEIWLTYGELKSIGVKIAALKKGVLRNSPIWQSTKDPDDHRCRLIRYSTLSETWKEEVRESLCGGLEPWEWHEAKVHTLEFSEAVKSRHQLQDSLRQVCEKGYIAQIHHYPGYEGGQLRSLCRAAGIVEETAKWYLKKEIPFRDHAPVKMASDWIKKHLDEYFPLKYIPVWPRLLLEKVKEFAVEKKAMNEIITIPRAGNGNGVKHKAEKWWQELAVYFRTDDRAFSQAQIYRKLNKIALRGEKECPSETIMRQFLRSKEHLTVEYHSDLNNKRLQRHRTSMPLSRAMFSDDCWEMDGTQVQFVGHLTGKKAASGRPEVKSLYIVTVRDVYSGAYLGYWYGYAENEHAYRSALKMAVETTGCLPYELRYDRFPGSTSANWKAMEGSKDEIGLLQKYGVKLTKTSKSTGKAHAERGFYTLQQVFESEKAGYIGQGIKSSLSYARPTEKYIARTQKEFLQNGWDYSKSVFEHMEVIAAYNHTPMSRYSRKYADLEQSPLSMYETGKDNCGLKVNPFQIADLFWNAREEGIRQGRIEFTHKGKPYQYYIGVDEFELLEYQRKGVTVTVRHDAFDLSSIMVFNNDGLFLAELRYQGKIQPYGRNADWAAAAKWKEGQAAISRKKKQELSEYDMSDETAALLPTSIEKEVYNDAQSRYALQNAGEWLPPKTGKKASKHVEEISMSESELIEYVRSQY